MSSLHSSSSAFVLAAALCLAACGGDDDGGGGAADAGGGSDAAPGADAAPDAPPAVTGLASSYTGPCDRISLSWDDAGDRAGVLVARSVGGPVAGAPASGETYEAGDELPGGGVVVYVGTAGSFDDTDGRYHGDVVHHAAFAYSAGHAYSAAAAAAPVTVDQTLGEQTATLSIALATGVVTVTQPSSFTLSGTAVYGDDADAVELEVEVTNGACRAVHQLAVRADAVGEGTVLGDVELAGTPALHFGPAALGDGDTEASSFLISGVTGAVDPLVIDVSLVDHPSYVTPGDWDDAAFIVDASGSGVLQAVDMDALAYNGATDDSASTSAVVSPDGERVYLGSRNQPMVVTVDLTTLTALGGADLTGADGIAFDGTGTLGNVAALGMSPDARYLYALVVAGGHRKFNAGDHQGRVVPAEVTVDIDLVRLERETLAEVDRLALVTNATGRPRPGQVAWSDDGTRVAIPMMRTGEVILVDLEDMSIVDTFDVSASGANPHVAAFSPDGATIALSYRSRAADELDLLTVADGTLTPLTHTTPSDATDGRTAFLAYGPDGRLYHGRKDADFGLSIFDLSSPAPSETELIPGKGLNGISFDAAGERYTLRIVQIALQVFEVATDVQVLFSATGGAEVTLPDTANGHLLAQTRL
ncbi:MAG TPA: hypothetical protein VMZ28_24355 [Kofleriaceae bacterium]|nr:hypothetical protein [Kofleriaceae bacterium]